MTPLRTNMAPSLRILWQFSKTSLAITPSIVPVPSSKFIKVNGFPDLSLICLTELIKPTIDPFLLSIFKFPIKDDLNTSICFFIAFTGWPDR